MMDAPMAKVMSDAQGMRCLTGQVKMGKLLSNHLKEGEPQMVTPWRWDAGILQADVYNYVIDLLALLAKKGH
jgi:hypothetical protein